MSGPRVGTIASMNAERDRAAAAQAQAQANAGMEPDDPERDWSQGGKLRYTLGRIPIVTMLTILTCVALWCWELSDDYVIGEHTICWVPVVDYGQWQRVFSSAYLHLSAIHIMMNLYALYVVGSAVEHQLGSVVMLGLVALFEPLQGLLHLPIMKIAAAVTSKESYLYTCAAGYSGVLFALWIVETALQMRAGVTSRQIGPIRLPIWLVPLFMLVMLSLFFPSISWQGHLAGVIVGFVYVKGLLIVASLPRVWLIWMQNQLPDFITRQRCWRAMPVEDPLEQFHFGFITTITSRVQLREPPPCEGCNCFAWCISCCGRLAGPRGALDGMRGGHRLGGGAGGAPPAAPARAAGAGGGHLERVPPGVAAGGGGAQQPFSSPAPARFPSLPPSAMLPVPSAPPAPPSQQQFHPAPSYEPSRSYSGSGSQQGFSMGGGDSESGGEYSRLMPAGDDSAAGGDIENPPPRAPSRERSGSARIDPPSREVSVLSPPSRSEPLLDANEQAFMNAQDL